MLVRNCPDHQQYAGVYSSFLRHAENASKTYGADTREILTELGKRRMVGGQEDMIIDVVPSIGAPKEAVRVILREVPPWHFAAGGELKTKPPGA